MLIILHLNNLCHPLINCSISSTKEHNIPPRMTELQFTDVDRKHLNDNVIEIINLIEINYKKL